MFVENSPVFFTRIMCKKSNLIIQISHTKKILVWRRVKIMVIESILAIREFFQSKGLNKRIGRSFAHLQSGFYSIFHKLKENGD